MRARKRAPLAVCRCPSVAMCAADVAQLAAERLTHFSAAQIETVEMDCLNAEHAALGSVLKV